MVLDEIGPNKNNLLKFEEENNCIPNLTVDI